MPEERKLVTVLFADIVGSTSMTVSADAEIVRARLASLFERARAILVEHGGTVEKFIGDEVMAVFGVPVAHEDDPERAIRAAVALRSEFASPAGGPIGALELRVGICTGEVVAGSGEARDFLVTGQAVNFAARLEKACAPGEILVGPLTRVLTLARARYGAERLVAAKGFGEIEAWPLEGVLPASAPSRPSTPFVGRARELALLDALWEHAVGTGRPYLVTLIGEAGIGKTRLAEELVARTRPSYVARARCAPYGEGLALRPIDEIVGPVPDDGVEPVVRLRKHLEARAASGPVAVVLDDIHWADPGLLDAVQEVIARARGPIFMVCLAREDLLASRPRWGGGRPNAASITVGPLADTSVRELVERLAGGTLRAPEVDYVIDHAEGNPLFVHEYVKTLHEAAGMSTSSIPPTLQALLAARLDNLPRTEREVLRRASVAGRSFGRDALRVLGLDEVESALEDAVTRELLVTSEDAPSRWSFVHALIRDVAYASLPKSERLSYHDRLSRWSEHERRDLAAAAFHAERAHEYARHLDADNEASLARRAFDLLRRAGHEAFGAGLSIGVHDVLLLNEAALKLAAAARADDDEIFETRAAAVMARLRLYGSAEAVAEMDALVASSGDRRSSETLVQLLAWKASVVVLDDPAQAETLLARAARVAEDVGDEGRRLYVRWASSEPAAAAGDRDREREVLLATLAAIPETPVERWSSLRVSCLADLVANALAANDAASAAGFAGRLDVFLERASMMRARFRALEATSRALLASGDVAGARQRAEACAAIAHDLASPWALARAALARAACLEVMGDANAAVSVLREALKDEEVAQRPTMRGVVTELRCALAAAFARSGDGAAARSEVEAARRTAPVGDARVRAHLDRADLALRTLTQR